MGPTRHRLLTLALPIALAQLAKRLMSVTDALWLGSLDIAAINAAAVAISLEVFPFFLAFAFSQGAFPAISRALKPGPDHPNPTADNADDDHSNPGDDLADHVSLACTATLAAGALVALAIWLIPGMLDPLRHLFPSVDLALVEIYLKYSSPGYPAAYANVVLIFVLAARHKGRVITINYAICCAVNVVIDGAFCSYATETATGVAGVALASTACRWITLIILWRSLDFRPRLDLAALRRSHRLFAAGAPFTLIKVGLASVTVASLAVIEPHGADYFASFNVSGSLFALVTALFIGVESALLLTLSQTPDHRGPILRELTVIALVLTALFAALILAVPPGLLVRWLDVESAATALRSTLLVAAASIPLVALMVYAQARQRLVANHLRSTAHVICATALKFAVLAVLGWSRPSYWLTISAIYLVLPCVEPLVYHLARPRSAPKVGDSH